MTGKTILITGASTCFGRLTAELWHAKVITFLRPCVPSSVENRDHAEALRD
jgi:NAD(P)-dependent dehydrogenase (short-subunit alcohol dehydrogenase family)